MAKQEDLMMLLQEFRELTAGLDGDLVLCCGGAAIQLVWHSERGAVSIDDDADYPLENDATVLYRNTEPVF